MDSEQATQSSPDTVILRRAGLTESQARGYLALIEHGALSPAELADKTGESRTNGYQICEKLEKLSLAERKLTPKNTYTPTSPQNLKKLVLAQQRKLRQTNDELAGLLPGLQSQFNLVSDEASITTLEGNPGIKALYADILREGHNISIFPSEYDRIDPSISAEIDMQISRQIERGIESRVLYDDVSHETAMALRDHDIHARSGGVGVPAQIIIYGQNVAISTFRQGMITTVIHHPDIAETIQNVFDALWEKSIDPLA